MKNIFIVQKDEAELAREIERRLLTLPEASGILFVGVEVVEGFNASKREPIFKVFIGCSRERDTNLMEAVAQRYLRNIVREDQLVVEARRGLVRP